MLDKAGREGEKRSSRWLSVDFFESPRKYLLLLESVVAQQKKNFAIARNDRQKQKQKKFDTAGPQI